MNRVAHRTALILFLGCSVFQGITLTDRVAIDEVAVRYMAANLCNATDFPCAVVFVRVGDHDPHSDLLERLRDLSALPASRAELFAEHSGDVWLRTRAKGTGRRGEILEISALHAVTSESVQVSVRYGVTSSVIQLIKTGGKWVVQRESITAITVA